MNLDFIRIRLFRWVIILFALWVHSGCHTGKGNQPMSIEKLINTSQSKLTDAYGNYLQRINNSTFILVESSNDLMLPMQSDFKQDISINPDLLYFPSTLWQMFSISGEKKWQQAAKDFSNIIIESKVTDFSIEPDAYQTLLYSSYLHTRNPESLTLLLERLSEIISQQENVFSFDSLSILSKTMLVEKLLTNEVLFFASKETGDPVYRNLALQNSELTYSTFPRTDSFRRAGNPKLQVLENRRLAIGLYGFSFLFKETGMERYKRLSNLLADNFALIINQSESENAEESAKCINHEMDLETQALVAVALFDLGDISENHYREISAQFFQHILATLSPSDNSDELQPSFQLFYYLFEYQKRLQNTGKGNDSLLISGK